MNEHGIVDDQHICTRREKDCSRLSTTELPDRRAEGTDAFSRKHRSMGETTVKEPYPEIAFDPIDLGAHSVDDVFTVFEEEAFDAFDRVDLSNFLQRSGDIDRMKAVVFEPRESDGCRFFPGRIERSLGRRYPLRL